jgi:hypothetical protein
MITFIPSKFDILGGNRVADHKYHIEIFRARFRKRFRTRWAWPKIMSCFILSKFVILGGNRMRGARNEHRDFPHALPLALPEAMGVEYRQNF